MGQPVWPHAPPPTPLLPTSPVEQGLCLLAVEGHVAGAELCCKMPSLGQYGVWNTGRWRARMGRDGESGGCCRVPTEL